MWRPRLERSWGDSKPGMAGEEGKLRAGLGSPWWGRRQSSLSCWGIGLQPVVGCALPCSWDLALWNLPERKGMQQVWGRIEREDEAGPARILVSEESSGDVAASILGPQSLSAQRSDAELHSGSFSEFLLWKASQMVVLFIEVAN